MDAFDDIVGRTLKADGPRERLAQIAALVGLPVDAFFDEVGPGDLQEMLRLWDAVDDEARAEILACARAAAVRARNAGV